MQHDVFPFALLSHGAISGRVVKSPARAANSLPHLSLSQNCPDNTIIALTKTKRSTQNADTIGGAAGDGKKRKLYSEKGFCNNIMAGCDVPNNSEDGKEGPDIQKLDRTNMSDGHGTYTWSNGPSYTGYWQNGLPDGLGKCTWKNGDVYEGEWSNGMFHGEGEHDSFKGVQTDGRWELGKLVFAHSTSDSIPFIGSASTGEHVTEPFTPLSPPGNDSLPPAEKVGTGVGGSAASLSSTPPPPESSDAESDTTCDTESDTTSDTESDTTPDTKSNTAGGNSSAKPPSPPGKDSLPPAEKVEMGGDGGCTAEALVNIGVYVDPNTKEDRETSLSAAKLSLNCQIDPVHNKFCTERGVCERGEVGEDNVQWHEEVIAKAVKGEGWHFKKVQINPNNKECVDLNEVLKMGSYLLIGVTNNKWKKGTKWITKYPGYSVNAPCKEPWKWVHSIAIVDGKVRDFCNPELEIQSLRILKNNQPNSKMGYMRTIRKVWRVYKCNKPGVGCKGKCGEINAA